VSTAQAVVRRVGRRRANAIAWGLIAYGAAGLLILGVLSVAVLPITSTIDTFALSTATVSDTLASTRDAFDGFNTSLVDAQRSAERAAAAARSSARAAADLATGMSLSIFGAQPLLPLATSFRQQSADLDGLAAELDRLALSLSRNGEDVRAIRSDVAELHARANALAPAADGPRWLVPAILMTLLWLAILPLASLVGGVLLRRA
jgi:hypothetical protein